MKQAKDDTAARDWLFGLIADLGMDVTARYRRQNPRSQAIRNIY
jgi:hypothetical protein